MKIASPSKSSHSPNRSLTDFVVIAILLSLPGTWELTQDVSLGCMVGILSVEVPCLEDKIFSASDFHNIADSVIEIPEVGMHLSERRITLHWYIPQHVGLRVLENCCIS